MTEASGRIVAGIGFATAATADELIGLIDDCLQQAGVSAEQLAAIGTHARKRGWAVPIVVAGHFGVPLRLLDDADLSSESVAEAVAAAAGLLRLGKQKSRYATCALADCRPGFDPGEFGQPPSPKAEMASSMVATSSAGP
jgi:cobalamin biosynthesis protein CbiG